MLFCMKKPAFDCNVQSGMHTDLEQHENYTKSEIRLIITIPWTSSDSTYRVQSKLVSRDRANSSSVCRAGTRVLLTKYGLLVSRRSLSAQQRDKTTQRFHNDTDVIYLAGFLPGPIAQW